jgi:hypothetical protein
LTENSEDNGLSRVQVGNEQLAGQLDITDGDSMQQAAMFHFPFLPPDIVVQVSEIKSVDAITQRFDHFQSA